MHHTEIPSALARAVTFTKPRFYTLATTALGLLTVLAACSGDSPTAALPTPSAVRSVVTGSAANAIGADGRIQLAAPPAIATDSELTAAQAVTFASLWTRDFAPMTRTWLEHTHGAAIDFKALSSCGRTLYARTAFNAPPQNIPGPYRRFIGPWWLVTFCDAGGSPSISVAISAWATDLTVVGGKLHFPRVSGTEVVAVGVPMGHVGEYPMAPEAAIAAAAQVTGRRISEVPELITPLQTDGPPQLARWHLTLEGPATVHARSGVRTVNDVFVSPTHVGGTGIATSAAVSNQPADVALDWSPVPSIGETSASYAARATVRTVKLARRADTPARVESISTSGN